MARKKKKSSSRKPSGAKSSEWGSFFWTVVLILFIRAFIVEPFKIPSGSMIPTLLIGDHLFVSKSAYDINIGVPLTSINKSLIRVTDPKRGDVIVFKFPDNGKNSNHAGKNYIKRVMGVPGDRVEIRAGIPIVNGRAYKRTLHENGSSPEETPGFKLQPYNELYKQHIPGSRKGWHWVRREPYRLRNLEVAKQNRRDHGLKDCLDVGIHAREPHFISDVMINEICAFDIPEDQYFVMGDNVDNSSDGRSFGFVPRNLIKGRALIIWLSLPGSEEVYQSSNPIAASLKDFGPSFIRMLKSPEHLKRIGRNIE